MKRGMASDESVWFVNTRRMLKAYIKHLEMAKHGTPLEDFALQWCKEQGILRVEVEMKKRELSALGLNDFGAITQEKLEALFEAETSVFRSVDRSDDVDIIDAIPARSRVYASAWLAGQDLRQSCSRATLFRHAKVLREFGLDILEPRNVQQFPVKVRIVDLTPVEAPAWYWQQEAA